MDERPRRRATAHRPATLAETPLEPQDEPIALLVDVNCDPRAWARPRGQIRPLPDLDRRTPPSARDVLAPGGGAVPWSARGTPATRRRAAVRP